MFPIDQKWFVGSTGSIGFGTITPTYDVEVTNAVGNTLVLGIKDNCSNATAIALDNTDPTGHNYYLASWGSAAGAGVLPGKFAFSMLRQGSIGSSSRPTEMWGIGPSVYFPASTLDVVGSVSAAVKNFRIDHPQDPANKTLTHSCIESSEMMNLYRGNVVLDASGQAEVQMPEWFEALNGDYSYQLTAIGASAPSLYVAEEIHDGRFSIAGGKPDMKVSWLVTGVRHDAYALAHPLEVVQDKGPTKGSFLYPKEHEALPFVAPR